MLVLNSFHGPLSSTFPVENRITTSMLRALKVTSTKLNICLRHISYFHQLLLIAKYLDVNVGVPSLDAHVVGQSSVSKGY